jgi:predicted transcriptional regulator
MYSEDLRWVAINLYCFQGYEKEYVAHLMGVSPTAISTWASMYSSLQLTDL